MTAAAQHDGVGHERGAAAVVQVEGERTEAGAVGDQQPRDVVLVDDRMPSSATLAASVCRIARPE